MVVMWTWHQLRRITRRRVSRVSNPQRLLAAIPQTCNHCNEPPHIGPNSLFSFSLSCYITSVLFGSCLRQNRRYKVSSIPIFVEIIALCWDKLNLWIEKFMWHNKIHRPLPGDSCNPEPVLTFSAHDLEKIEQALPWTRAPRATGAFTWECESSHPDSV